MSDIDQLLNKTKGGLFFQKRAGFLGSLLCKINIEWNPEIPTACINASTLYWNPDFFLSLDDKTRITVLAHELWHNASLHGVRMAGRDPEQWNIACDHAINLMLEDDGYYMGGFPYIKDKKYADSTIWSAEAIYDDLMKNGGSKQQNPMAGDIMPISGKEEVAKAISQVVAAITTARLSGQAGEVPGSVSMIVDAFLNPRLPWETILYNFMNEITSEEYSYRRANRRYDDPILPGKTGNNGLEHLMHFQDISGSIQDKHIQIFNSELKHIWEEFNPKKMTVCTFDHQLQDEYIFEEGDDFNQIKVTGRGGTSLHGVFEKIHKEKPTAAVIFTDLEVNIPPNPGIPIIWVCIDSPSMKVPYGKLIHMDSR